MRQALILPRFSIVTPARMRPRRALTNERLSAAQQRLLLFRLRRHKSHRLDSSRHVVRFDATTLWQMTRRAGTIRH
jgi:hypothetical protein